MKTIYFLLLGIFLSYLGHTQNLVPNNSFEQYSICPNNYHQINYSLFWFNPCDPPYGPSGSFSGSSDYYNACDTFLMGVPYNGWGFQPARTGNGYAGIIPYISFPNYREYIEIQLITPLLSGVNYYFEMYVNPGDNSEYAIDKLSVYFSDTLISGLHNHEPLPYVPQISNLNGIISDTSTWTLISGNYTASGSENYLLIGNFSDDNNTNWSQIGTNTTGSAYYFIDDVSLTLATDLEEVNHTNYVIVYPSPFKNNLNIIVQNNEQRAITVYDLAFRKLLHQNFSHKILLNTEQLSNGIYIYEVINKNEPIRKGKIVKG